MELRYRGSKRREKRDGVGEPENIHACRKTAIRGAVDYCEALVS